MRFQTIPTFVEVERLETTTQIRVYVTTEGGSELADVLEAEAGEFLVTDEETGEIWGVYSEDDLYEQFEQVEGPECEGCDCYEDCWGEEPETCCCEESCCEQTQEPMPESLGDLLATGKVRPVTFDELMHVLKVAGERMQRQGF